MPEIKVGSVTKLKPDYDTISWNGGNGSGQKALVAVSGMVVHPGVCNDMQGHVVITPLVSLGNGKGWNLYMVEARGCTIAEVVEHIGVCHEALQRMIAS